MLIKAALTFAVCCHCCLLSRSDHVTSVQRTAMHLEELPQWNIGNSALDLGLQVSRLLLVC